MRIDTSLLNGYCLTAATSTPMATMEGQADQNQVRALYRECGDVMKPAQELPTALDFRLAAQR
jgi:hypothetical protein